MSEGTLSRRELMRADLGQLAVASTASMGLARPAEAASRLLPRTGGSVTNLR